MRTKVPLPALVSVPVPEMVPKLVPWVRVLVRLNESAALLVIALLAESEPVVLPAPICSVPA